MDGVCRINQCFSNASISRSFIDLRIVRGSSTRPKKDEFKILSIRMNDNLISGSVWYSVICHFRLNLFSPKCDPE